MSFMSELPYIAFLIYLIFLLEQVCMVKFFTGYRTLAAIFWYVHLLGGTPSYLVRFFTLRVFKQFLPVRYAVLQFYCGVHTGTRTPQLNWQRKAMLRIHDILGWIRIRGSIPLTNVSGSGSCYFRHWPSRCQQKTNFLHNFFCLLLFEGTFTSFFEDKKSKRVTK